MVLLYLANKSLKWTEKQMEPYITSLNAPVLIQKKKAATQSQSSKLKVSELDPPLKYPEILLLAIKVLTGCLANLVDAAKRGDDVRPDSSSGVVVAFRQAFAIFMYALLGHRYTSMFPPKFV